MARSWSLVWQKIQEPLTQNSKEFSERVNSSSAQLSRVSGSAIFYQNNIFPSIADYK